MVWQHAVEVVTMVQPSRRGTLRRVDALERKSICLALWFAVRVGCGFRTAVRNHRQEVEYHRLRLVMVDHLDGSWTIGERQAESSETGWTP